MKNLTSDKIDRLKNILPNWHFAPYSTNPEVQIIAARRYDGRQGIDAWHELEQAGARSINVCGPIYTFSAKLFDNLV